MTHAAPAVREIRTRRVLREAEDEFVDCDSLTTKDNWLQGTFGQRYLNEKALAAISRSVRDSKRATWEFRLKLVGGIVTGATGLIGAIIGLVALLKKK